MLLIRGVASLGGEGGRKAGGNYPYNYPESRFIVCCTMYPAQTPYPNRYNGSTSLPYKIFRRSLRTIICHYVSTMSIYYSVFIIHLFCHIRNNQFQAEMWICTLTGSVIRLKAWRGGGNMHDAKGARDR